MKEVYKNLFVGTEQDFEYVVKGKENWAVVHACKEPYHRQALGYKGRGAPKNSPEYLFAIRANRLILNLVDADNPAYIPKQIIDKALDFIYQNLNAGQKVLVHCNQGQSRSPSIVMLYLAEFTDIFSDKIFQNVEKEFRLIYSSYLPSNGIRMFMYQNWDEYIKEKREENEKIKNI